MVAEANRYFAGEAPWALAKTDPARQGTVLYVTAEVVRQIAILAQPVDAGRLRRSCSISLGIPADERDFAASAARTRIRPGTGCRRRRGISRAMSSRTAPPERSNRCSSTAIAISIFPDFADDLDAIVARARRPPASGAW